MGILSTNINNNYDIKNDVSRLLEITDKIGLSKVYAESSLSQTTREVTIPGVEDWGDVTNIPLNIRAAAHGVASAATLNINGLGAKTLYFPSLTADGITAEPPHYWVRAGQVYMVVWDGARLLALNSQFCGATTSYPGIAQLSSSTSSTSETLAATASAVKAAYDKAAAAEAAATAAAGASEISFVYNCTGTNDDLAIQNLVNSFISNGTAASMKLIISGTMGLQENPAKPSGYDYAAHIALNATSSRIVAVTLDFSNCTVPDITVASRTFLYLKSSYITITGLSLNASERGVYMTSGSHNKIMNCIISGRYGIYIYYSSYNVIVDSTITNAPVYGIFIYSSSGNAIINCSIVAQGCFYGNSNANVTMFMNCSFLSTTSNGFGVGFNNSSNNSIINCIFNHNYGGTRGFFVRGTGTNNMLTRCSFDSVGNYGVCAETDFSGSLTLDSCKIIGATAGIQVETANTDAEIKLVNCLVKGTGTQDIQQTTAAGSVKWHIMGNTFSRASVIVDGTSAIAYKTISTNIYFPQYANKFSRTIN